MSTAIAFDTLKFVRRLRDAGVDEKQAEALSEALSDIASEKLVSQEYLDMRLKELEYRLLTRLGGLMLAGFGILGALLKMH
ncbi:MAG: DUF1640 domain-containing protein [Magnetococcales bacterium]|nr:DUF1640 domain-containing protein [Magnetococcales bacterium]